MTQGRRVLGTLCLSQLVGWGVLYYAFSVLQHDIAADTGWSPAHVAGAFTTGQVTAALGGVLVGRLLDERGPRVLMTAGSGLAVGGVTVVATASDLRTFVLGWITTGAAMAATLYGPAFAALTGWFEDDRRLRALAALTIVGGLASTVFAPLTALLHERLNWRGTYLLLATVLAFTVPLHWYGLRGPWPARRREDSEQWRPRRLVRSRAFLGLAVILAGTGLCATAAVVNLVPLLREQGVGLETAGLLLALGGVGQVLGRVGHTRLAGRLSPDMLLLVVVGTLVATSALLGIISSVAAAVLVVLVAGAARGSLTLVRATAVTDRWGPRDYARLSGVLSLPVALASAAGPWVGAQLAESRGGYASSYLALATVNAVTVLACLAWVRTSTCANIDLCRSLPSSSPRSRPSRAARRSSPSP